MTRRSAGVRVALGAALAVAAAPLGCGRGDPGGPPPPEVLVATVRAAAVPDRREYVGNVRAVDSVEVRARVRGYLIEQRFEDGKAVQKGDLLFRIDPSTYQVALADAKGQLARARAAAERARREFARAEQLMRDNVASQSVYDARRADRDAAEAEIASAEARVRAAELNLSYTTVSAPISGRIGRAVVDVGNLVGESGQDTVLAQIVQTDPIHVDFAPTERDRLGVLRDIAKGRFPAQSEGVPVKLVLGDGTPYPHDGVIDFIDPTIEPTRGTVAVRARVPNPEGNLKPGEYVRVIVVRPDVPDALLVPQRAVQDQQGGSYVLVVKGDDTVEPRPVTLGVLHDGMQQITEGVAAGERVIVEGVQKARPGQKVAARPIGAEGVAAQKDAPAKREGSS
ncbi:MAG: efflux RND transporter periplasmic adaptor subunit [Deltaproteobacteria bacterium]|nr:MAG: efflux RND transporter periplasmic adaptor subunit [Deltaproteobacteria bacterium]